MSGKSGLVENRILHSLPLGTRRRLLGSCALVNLTFGELLCEANQPIRHGYFPLTAFLSLVIVVDKHQPLELGMIGNEGMVGASIALGVAAVPLRIVVQGAGSALRIPVASLRRELRMSPALRRAASRHLYISMQQLAQTAACNCFHESEARLSRWLLMTHDRAHADNFRLTHQFLADMLGLRRSAVTIAAGALHARNLISYTRGHIRIIDRPGLEAAACVCYAQINAAYDRLFAVR